MAYSSVSLKEKLTQVQLHLGMAKRKLMQEAKTRWNIIDAATFGAKGVSQSSASWATT